MLAACVGLGFVPEHRSQAHLDRQRDSAIIEDVGQNLTVLTKMQIKLSPPHFNPTEEALESVQELGREFKKGKLVRDEALAKLSSLAEQLRDQSSKIGHERMRQQRLLRRLLRRPRRVAAARLLLLRLLLLLLRRNLYLRLPPLHIHLNVFRLRLLLLGPN